MNDSRPQTRQLELPPNCNSCQYCKNCDEKPGAARDILRFCIHGQGSNFVELRDIQASGHDCLTTGPVRRDANPGWQPGLPQERWVAPSAQNPQAQSGIYTPDATARAGSTFKNASAEDDSDAHFGHNYADVPQVEGPMVYEGLKASGNATCHAGNNYGLGNEQETRRHISDRAARTPRVFHGNTFNQETYLPATNEPEHKRWRDRFRNH